MVMNKDPEVFRLSLIIKLFNQMDDEERDRTLIYLRSRYGIASDETRWKPPPASDD